MAEKLDLKTVRNAIGHIQILVNQLVKLEESITPAASAIHQSITQLTSLESGLLVRDRGLALVSRINQPNALRTQRDGKTFTTISDQPWFTRRSQLYVIDARSVNIFGSLEMDLIPNSMAASTGLTKKIFGETQGIPARSSGTVACDAQNRHHSSTRIFSGLSMINAV